ncbi:hypothetical protein MJM59_29255, partial [Salmonella enterica subsp. enterica serovar Montevideo]|nr:hypothetical protein [Salmonella enterica subsp. enterica serovar Montevideo]
VTRWILYNGDQQVAAFALPATCRPEGFLAAQRNGTLLQLEPHLDSVRMMGLAARWRKVHGDIDFVMLAKNPTIDAWWALLSRGV